MKSLIINLFFVILCTQFSLAQNKAEKELVDLSKQKWQCKEDKKVDELAELFHNVSELVNMSVSCKKSS